VDDGIFRPLFYFIPADGAASDEMAVFVGTFQIWRRSWRISTSMDGASSDYVQITALICFEIDWNGQASLDLHRILRHISDRSI